MQRVFCFGELLMRLSPQLKGEWIRQGSMPVFIGGAELNTATALAGWGAPVSYGTALPDHYLSREILDYIRERQIDTSKIQFSGSRIGTYYLPQGADLQHTGVIYDRAYSSFWELKPGQINWGEIFQDVGWFHFSAISPALNPDVAAVCREAVQEASKRNITISVDLNYRDKLWQYGKQPQEIMPELVSHCDVVMGNIWAAEKMLAIPVPKTLPAGKEAFLNQSLETSEKISRAFPRCQQVANTFRLDAMEGVNYYATLFSRRQFYVSKEHHAESFMDKVGSGDTFMAGLIYGNYCGWPPQEILDFSGAAAFNKLFIKGDASTASVEEIKKRYIRYA